MNQKAIDALLLKTFQEYWESCQGQYPIINEITSLDAIDKLLSFRDNPQGPLENHIDSLLMVFETPELEYIKSLLVANY